MVADEWANSFSAKAYPREQAMLAHGFRDTTRHRGGYPRLARLLRCESETFGQGARRVYRKLQGFALDLSGGHESIQEFFETAKLRPMNGAARTSPYRCNHLQAILCNCLTLSRLCS